MLEQHGSSRLARQSRTCRVESSEVEFGLLRVMKQWMWLNYLKNRNAKGNTLAYSDKNTDLARRTTVSWTHQQPSVPDDLYKIIVTTKLPKHSDVTQSNCEIHCWNQWISNAVSESINPNLHSSVSYEGGQRHLTVQKEREVLMEKHVKWNAVDVTLHRLQQLPTQRCLVTLDNPVSPIKSLVTRVGHINPIDAHCKSIDPCNIKNNYILQ